MEGRLLALLLHTLLRRHTGICALLGGLLLLEVGLVLQSLLLVGSHTTTVGLLRHVTRHALSHWLSHLRCSVVLLFGRVDCGLAVDTVGIGGLGRIEASLVGLLVLSTSHVSVKRLT